MTICGIEMQYPFYAEERWNSGDRMEEETRGTRKKIWQISGCYHCSIIGICLGRSDLRRLSRKNNFELHSYMSDYTLHNILTSLVKNKSHQSRALHKILDKKYGLAIKKYHRLQSPEDLVDQWQNDLRTNDLAGPYWAIMTHRAANSEVLNRIYGDCHMLSFDCFSSRKAENRALVAYKNANKRLRGEIEDSKKDTITLKKQQRDSSRQLKTLSRELSEITQQNRQLVQRIAQLQQTDDMRRQQNEARRQIHDLTGEVEKQSRQMSQLEQYNDSLSLLIRQQELQIESYIRLISRQSEEIALSEGVEANGSHDESVCVACGDACSCPLNLQLRGKKVLYVGGHHKMVAHYKQIVERHGAQFLYHDGGKEHSRHILPRLLDGADAVFCPVDCVSHDACKCVKKMCKRNSKPFVMMRSSGVSSFAKSLNEIRQ